MIQAREIHKSFGRVLALRGVSFELHPGQVTGLLGPNGAGKSTTIRIVTGFLPPDRGTVRVDGLDAIDDSREARRQIGYLPESTPLYPEMRTIDYLRFRARLYGLSGKTRKHALEEAIDRCWLKEVRERRIGHLSKGYRQRVGLAAAIIHNPPVLILDEPANGLDPEQIRQMRALIRELGAERTVLVSSHLLPEVERTCDRVIIIARGLVRADGSPESLLRQANTAIITEVKPDQNASRSPEEALRQLPGVTAIETEPLDGGWVRLRVTTSTVPAHVPIPGNTPRDAQPAAPSESPAPTDDARAAIASALAASGAALRELRAEQPSLESLYMSSIEEEAA